MFSRTNGVLGSTVPLINPLSSLTITMNLDSSRKAPCCPVCSTGYEQELAKLKESEKQPDEVKNSLPQWLQNAKPKDQSQKVKQAKVPAKIKKSQ